MPVIIGVIAVVVFILLITWLQDQKQSRRTRQLRRQAEILGLTYAESSGPRLLEQTYRFLLFAQGRTGSARNVIRGTRPTPGPETEKVDVEVFEYTFSAPLGRYTESWRQSVIRLTDTSLDLPSFSLMPEPVFETMVKNARDRELRERLVGTAGISFREHPDFTERMHLHGTARKAVQALFSDDLVAFFKAHTDLCCEGSGPYLIIYRFDRLISPKNTDEILNEALQVYGAVKESGQASE
ncbi:MAG: hypothetical protein MUQ30_05520 [Anaerolineae bacterium]|nr:hypothetical protein [Anaerolineae bacterium]